MPVTWRVIVADGSEITCRGLAATIRQGSDAHQVVECCTSEEALALLSEAEPTLLLVDLLSPGLRLVSEARSMWPDVRIVVTAGDVQVAAAVAALQAGADGYLVKGMLATDLMACLRCVVDIGTVVVAGSLRGSLRTPLSVVSH